MLRLICYVCLFLSSITATSQEYFSKTYLLADSINTRGRSILNCENNLIVLAGRRCQNFSVDCGDINFLDEDGNLNWRRNYEWTDYNFRPILLNEDTIITVGCKNVGTFDEWYFTKTNFDGDSISNDTFNFSQTHLWNVNIGVGKIPSGYLMYGFGRELDSTEILSFVLLDESGKLDTLYNKQFHPEYNWMLDVREDFSGDMVFVENNFLGETLLDERRIIRMNREGEVSWNWTTGSQLTQRQPNAFEIHFNGSYLFTQHDDQSDPFQIRDNPYIYHVDTAGVLKWIHQIYPSDLFRNRITVEEMTIAKNGDILLVGDALIWNDQWNNFYPSRGYIARINYEGEMLWEKYIFDRYENGSPRESFLFDIVEMEDGSIAATGIQDRIQGEPWADMWLVKLSPDGCLNTPNCSDTLDISVPVEEIENQLIDFNISPNPSNGFFIFEFRNPFAITNDLELLIYNEQGHILTKQNFSTSVEIDLSPQPSGMYFYSILNNTQILDSGKLLKHD
jgi:hypothetical protein